MHITDLDFELIQFITTFLTVVDNLCLSITCQRFRNWTELVSKEPHPFGQIKYMLDPRVSDAFKTKFHHQLDTNRSKFMEDRKLVMEHYNNPFISTLAYIYFARVEYYLDLNWNKLYFNHDISTFTQEQINYLLIFVCKYALNKNGKFLLCSYNDQLFTYKINYELLV